MINNPILLDVINMGSTVKNDSTKSPQPSINAETKNFKNVLEDAASKNQSTDNKTYQVKSQDTYKVEEKDYSKDNKSKGAVKDGSQDNNLGNSQGQVNESKTDNTSDKTESTTSNNSNVNSNQKVETGSEAEKVETQEKAGDETELTAQLANQMGIDQQTLLDLLEALNINVSSISNLTDIKELAEKLTGIVNQVIASNPDLSVKLKVDIKENPNGNLKVKAKLLIDTLKSEITESSKNELGETGEKLVLKIKEQIKTSMQEIKDLGLEVKEPQKLDLKILEVLQNVLPKTSGAEDKSQDSNSNQKEVIDIQPTDAKPVQTNAPKQQNASNNEVLDQAPQTVSQPENSNQTETQDTAEKDVLTGIFQNAKVINLKTNQSSENLINDNAVTVQPGQNQNLTSKVDIFKNILNKANVTKDELFNQVIERAKLVLTDTQTQMEMTLKPESLGKLSLKVITENGIVMAKITTESQQVKAVIESNLVQLQESLKQQGLNIQNLSVSVGQDKRQEFLQNQKATKLSKVTNLDREYIKVSGDYFTKSSIKNPYLIQESRIDFTA